MSPQVPPSRTPRGLWKRLLGLLPRPARERDMADEFESNLQLHIEECERAGMSPAEARTAALMKFGGVAQAKEAVREVSTLQWLETTLQDFRYALRGLRRNPGFAAAAILSLALGIGAGLAIFAVADSLLLRPLPVKDADRVVMVWEHNRAGHGSLFNVISPGNYRDWKAQSSVFEQMASFADGRVVLRYGGRAEELPNRFATAELLAMLGVKPFRGRFFTGREDTPTGPAVIVISYRLWQQWFGGEESVIGKPVQLRSAPCTIIGVLPPNFSFRYRNIDIWEPMGYDPARDYRLNSGRFSMAVARLKPGVSFAAAQAQMTAIAARLEKAYPVFDTNWTVLLEPLRDSMVRQIKTSIEILLGAVGLLLVVACVNVANLLLARYTSRQRELAVRLAIGASRARVTRQLLAESLTLSFAGGALGLAIAKASVAGLTAMAPLDIAQNAAVPVDFRIAAFAFALALLTGIVFGLGPAYIAVRSRTIAGLREGGRSGIGGGVRLRSALVAAEIALSLMLVSGAGLLFRTVTGLQAVNPGINPRNVLTFRVSLQGPRYRDPASRMRVFRAALDSLRGLPGVRSASAVSYLPFDGLGAGTDFAIGGRPPAKPGEDLSTGVDTVMPGYFAAMGIPVVSGRDFTAADNTADSPYRFLVNRTFVRRYFADTQPLGQTISVSMDTKNPFGEIIGVVGDVKAGALDKEPEPTVYYIHAHLVYNAMIFVARTQSDPMLLADSARRIVHAIDPAQPVAEVRTMESIVRETFSRQRFSAILLAAFSLVSIVLAAVGIYGVLAYSVTERTAEIGIRVALGAQPAGITSLIAGHALRMLAAGMAAGLVGALSLTGLLRSLLFGVSPRDWTTLALACMVLSAAALAAAYLPARRAARLMPLDALRSE